MFVSNWKKIWDLAMMREVPVDEGFDEFRQAVKYGVEIEGIDFDFKSAHEEWKKMSESEQLEVTNEYLNFVRRSYSSLVKEYSKK